MSEYDKHISLSARIANEAKFGLLPDSAWRFYIECSLFASASTGKVPSNNFLAWLLHRKEQDIIERLTELEEHDLAYHDGLTWVIRQTEHIEAITVGQTGGVRYVRGYAYVIYDGGTGLYKIGASADPEKRLSQLKTATPTSLTLEHAIPTDDMYELEEIIHVHFEDKRVTGEWFKLDQDDLYELINWGEDNG